MGKNAIHLGVISVHIAELVTVAGPSDLHATINHAEKVEMARNLAGSGEGGQ